jgi:hypothetical protein
MQLPQRRVIAKLPRRSIENWRDSTTEFMAYFLGLTADRQLGQWYASY